ncbi:MAG: hypothetical protein AAF694_03670 [Bacteroidota bacterium]
MEQLLKQQFSWGYLGIMAVVLLGGYFLLQFLMRLLKQASYQRGIGYFLKIGIEQILFLYEPIAVFLLTGIFVFINPIFHGFLLALLLIPGFQHLRNYESGKIIQAGKGLSLGKKIKSGNLQGIIVRTGRLGLELQSDGGVHFVPYRQLLMEGYTIISGQEIQSFHQLSILPKGDETDQDHEAHLFNQLIATPYLDLNYSPEFTKREKGFDVRILLKKEEHITHLIDLMEEWGYQSKEVHLV